MDEHKYGPHYNGLKEPWMWGVIIVAVVLSVVYSLIWY